ncbi:MAG: hypothetical protein ACLSHW_05045 [Lachnospiraceae bacterium]
MATGWQVNLGGAWYYLNGSGAMAHGLAEHWEEPGIIRSGSGAMAANT